MTDQTDAAAHAVPDLDTSEWTSIRIAAPLPLNVAGALMQMIGTAWPEAVIQQSERNVLHMLVPPARAADVDQEFLERLGKTTEDVTAEAEFLGFRDGWLALAPPEELQIHLGGVAHSIFTSHQPDAINHVEWEVKTGNEPDDAHYVLSISTRKERTPLAMRKQAEAEVERLKSLLESHGIDPEEKS